MHATAKIAVLIGTQLTQIVDAETVPERVWRTGRQNPKRRTIRELIDPEQPGDATPDLADVITDKIHEQEQVCHCISDE